MSISAFAASLILMGGRAEAAGTPFWVLQQNRRAAEQYQRREVTPRTVRLVHTPAAHPTPVPLDP
jgi:hypothetical protein